MSIGKIQLVCVSLFISTAFASESIVKSLLETRQCPACELVNMDLSELDLSGVNLSGANLSGSDLSGTNFRGANLQGANLYAVVLSDTLLAGANLKDTNLSHLDVDRALEHLEIVGTQLEGANFADGVVCGPPPKRGGWGCQHSTPIDSD